VEEISSLEPTITRLNDSDFPDRTIELRTRVASGVPLESVLPEAFAIAREAARRILGLRPYDVQLIGGMALNDGKIAEMKTGEGKTLVATLAAYLNALSGNGVHIVTVNDYLAARDCAWMGEVYRFLGMSSGAVTHGLSDEERKAQYACDVTFITNNELGFDFLRDNMKFRLVDTVQRPFSYAIVDEVDSILIDESRTPLIISGPTDETSDIYGVIDGLVIKLIQDPSKFEVDEKNKGVSLTDRGVSEVERLLVERRMIEGGSLFDLANINLLHHIYQGLRAHTLFTRDVNYVVRDGRVIIVDEFTGRMMPGRRFSDGLHQALEAKERVDIQPENQTLASITFQNLFRLYPKLSGMTGTAVTEADEFHDIYDLDVVEIPTNALIRRVDENDEVYRTEDEKFAAVARMVEESRSRCQPVLIGTISIEKSEKLSKVLQRSEIPHAVLNARFHEQEAQIIAQAGAPGAVTIATNMAGRGTDIRLGGQTTDHSSQLPDTPRSANQKSASPADPEAIVRAAGGLFVIGTERHESRRVDNQLRGRSGRQGDPGRSKFVLSLEDDLMRIFGSDRVGTMLDKLGMQQGEAIAHPWINTAIEKAQKKVEARNFEIRKNLLRYDDVIDSQRREIYAQRRTIMEAEDCSIIIDSLIDEVADQIVGYYNSESEIPYGRTNIGHPPNLVEQVIRLAIPQALGKSDQAIHLQEIKSALRRCVYNLPQHLSVESVSELHRRVIIDTLDRRWTRHINNVDMIRQGIGLRAYGQRDPLHEYKVEAFALFNDMLSTLRVEIILALSNITLTESVYRPYEPLSDAYGVEPQIEDAPPDESRFAADRPSEASRVGRNRLCPCGSGKKFKHCHGRLS